MPDVPYVPPIVLTSAEQRVIEGVIRQESVDAIAGAIERDPRVVATHLENVARKLDLYVRLLRAAGSGGA